MGGPLEVSGLDKGADRLFAQTCEAEPVADGVYIYLRASTDGKSEEMTRNGSKIIFFPQRFLTRVKNLGVSGT